MEILTWLGKAFTLLACLSLTTPVITQESQAKTTHSINKSDSKKSSAKKASVKKAAEKKNTGNTLNKKSVTAKNDSDRDIWLKRATSSEALTGKASWYGRDFHNKATASGLAYDMHTFTAAHRTLPMGTVVKVTDQTNGKSVMVCVTDRGPYVQGRIIDLSFAAAKKLDLNTRGVGKVALEVVSDPTGAPLKNDHAYFVRYSSDNGKNRVGPFDAFSDASAMREALSQAHPEAEVVLENSRKSQ